MNKKTICLIGSLLLLSLTACGGKESSTEPETKQTPDSTGAASSEAGESSSEAAQDDRLSFDYTLNGVTLPVSEEADALIAKLGTPDSTFDAPSCAFTGVSHYYTFGGVQVVTYPDEHNQNLNRIYEVDLKDNTAATPEGIKVGSTYPELINACGKPDQETAGYAMYKTEGKAVQFFLSGNDITEIVYTVVLT